MNNETTNKLVKTYNQLLSDWYTGETSGIEILQDILKGEGVIFNADGFAEEKDTLESLGYNFDVGM